MKYVYSFFTLFITFSLSGQSGNKQAEDIIRKYAEYWSVPSHSMQVNERSLVFAPTYKLDSLVSIEENGVRSFRAEMDYNALGHTVEMRQFDVDSSTFELFLSNVFTFEYETPGYPSHILNEAYDPDLQQFVPALEMDITYDGANRVDSVVISLEDPLFGGGFGPLLAVKQVYSGDLLIQTRQWIYIALLGGWFPSGFSDLTYNQDDLLSEQITYILDFSTGEIIPDSRTIYEYNAQGLQQNITRYLWVDPMWEPNQQNFFEYYGNGSLSSETRLFYDINTLEWTNNYRIIYPVENADFEYPVVSYFWDPIQSAWFETDSLVDLLNPSIKWEDVAAPREISILSILGGETGVSDFEPNASIIDETRYFYVDSLTGEFSLDYRDVYYYSLFEGSSVSPVLPAYLSILPNPAQDQFFIELDADKTADFSVYTITGSVVMQGNLQEGKTSVQTSGWASGMYYVIIRMQDGHTYAHKQMVE